MRMNVSNEKWMIKRLGCNKEQKKCQGGERERWKVEKF